MYCSCCTKYWSDDNYLVLQYCQQYYMSLLLLYSLLRLLSCCQGAGHVQYYNCVLTDNNWGYFPPILVSITIAITVSVIADIDIGLGLFKNEGGIFQTQ